MNPIIKLVTLLLIASSCWTTAIGQDIDVNQGISISIAFPKKLRIMVSYNVNFSTHLELSNATAITPLVDVKVSLFRNHIGNNVLKTYTDLFNGNVAVTYGAMYSMANRDSLETYFYPTFASVYHSSARSKYKSNIGIARTTSFHFPVGNNANIERKLMYQNVNNVMMNFKHFYASYFNDGGDPLSSFIGDGKDRYWTAGLTLGYIIDAERNPQQLQLAYDQFTGYSKYAYEASGILFVDNVYYSNYEQFGYNSSRVSLKYTRPIDNWGVSLQRWNLPIQDIIHRDVTKSPYHSRIEGRYYDIEAYWLPNINTND